jgi:hypothetical protein
MKKELRIAPARYNQPKPGSRRWHSRGAHFGGLLPLFLSTTAIIIPGRKIRRKEVEDEENEEENDDDDGAAASLSSNERPITLINGKGEGRGF